MTNLFLVRYKDGGLKTEELKVKSSKKIQGELTKQSLQHLINRGYAAWINLTNVIGDPRHKLEDYIAKEFGI